MGDYHVGTGQTYSTLQAFLTAKSNTGLTERALCHGSVGSGTQIGGSSTLIIDAASGEELSASIPLLDIEGMSNITIRNVRVTQGIVLFNDGATPNWLIERVLCDVDSEYEGHSIQCWVQASESQISGGVVTVRNCDVLRVQGQLSLGISVTFDAGLDSDLTANLFNNTVKGDSNSLDAGIALFSGDAGQGGAVNQLVAVLTNNICIGSASGDYVDGGSQSTNHTTTYCSDGDGQLDANFGGHPSNNLFQTINGTFVGLTNSTLLPSSPAKNTGTTLGSFSDDILGRSRPQGAAWDRGCRELPAASASNMFLVF